MQTITREMPYRFLPALMTTTASIIPLLIIAQLFLAGLAIFADVNFWELHGTVGGFIALPIIGALLMGTLSARLRILRGFSILTFSLYALQLLWLVIGETIAVEAVRAAHAANAGLLLLASATLAHRSIRTLHSGH